MAAGLAPKRRGTHRYHRGDGEHVPAAHRLATADGGRGAWKRNLFNYSFVGYIARQTGVPDLVIAIRIEEGTPTVARVGHLEMPVMSFELFRRIATDAITTPDLLADRPVTLTRSADR